jgi:hypothetical protein
MIAISLIKLLMTFQDARIVHKYLSYKSVRMAYVYMTKLQNNFLKSQFKLFRARYIALNNQYSSHVEMSAVFETKGFK